MEITAARSGWALLIVKGLSVVLAFWFIGSGMSKLLGAQGQIDNFANWGYPGWFMYLTGTLEVLAALLLLVSLFVARLATAGAAILVCIMIGALYTRVVNGESVGTIIPPIVLLVAAAIIGWMRRDEWLASR